MTNYCLNFAVFDEPKQQSIVNKDFSEFIEQSFQICNSTNCQIILGVTAKDKIEKSVVTDAKRKGAHIISLIGKAFKPFE